MRQRRLAASTGSSFLGFSFSCFVSLGFVTDGFEDDGSVHDFAQQFLVTPMGGDDSRLSFGVAATEHNQEWLCY